MYVLHMWSYSAPILLPGGVCVICCGIVLLHCLLVLCVMHAVVYSAPTLLPLLCRCYTYMVYSAASLLLVLGMSYTCGHMHGLVWRGWAVMQSHLDNLIHLKCYYSSVFLWKFIKLSNLSMKLCIYEFLLCYCI